MAACGHRRLVLEGRSAQWHTGLCLERSLAVELAFELGRGKISQARMTASGIIPAFDELKDRQPGLVLVFEDTAIKKLALE